MEQEQTVVRSHRSSGCLRFVLVAFAVVVVFLMCLFALTLLTVYRSPYYRSYTECRSRIVRVGQAVDRYSIKNDVYPDDLRKLVPDYISESDLRCPLVHDAAATYDYRKPGPRASADTILLECRRHRLKPGLPVFSIKYLKNGRVIPG